MKIALISPRGQISINPNCVKFWDKTSEIIPYRESFTGFSSGLLIIASLTPKSWEIDLIDENIESIDFNKTYNIVAISSMTQQATRAYQIAEIFRKKGAKIIIGGIHSTILPEEVKQYADIVVIGEAEEVWPKILKDFLNKDTKPFYRATNLIDLRKSPIPRYDLVKSEKYKVVWIQTSRGCPLDCEFCCAPKIYGRKFRYKGVRQILKELKFILNIWGHKPLISFADDNMFINRRFASEMIKEISDLKIEWFAQTDISIGEDRKFLELLRKSGCRILFIGFESLNYKNLVSISKTAWKAKYLNKYSKIIKKIQGYGIGVMGSFIVGFDEDTTSVFKKIADFIIENNMFAAQITILTPLPGTRLRKRLLEEGRLLHTGWDNYTFSDVNFIPKRMSAQELQNGLLDIYKKIYSPDVRLKKAHYFKRIYLSLKNKEKQGSYK